MTYLLTTLLTAAIAWTAGHRTARIRIIVIGATEQQDQAALLADERRRFNQLVADLEQPTDHDDTRDNA